MTGFRVTDSASRSTQSCRVCTLTGSDNGTGQLRLDGANAPEPASEESVAVVELGSRRAVRVALRAAARRRRTAPRTSGGFDA